MKRSAQWSPDEFEAPLVDGGHALAKVRISDTQTEDRFGVDARTFSYAYPDWNGDVPRLNNYKAWLVLSLPMDQQFVRDGRLERMRSDPAALPQQDNGLFMRTLRRYQQDPKYAHTVHEAMQRHCGRSATAEELATIFRAMARSTHIASAEHALINLPDDYYAAALAHMLPVYRIAERQKSSPKSNSSRRVVTEIPFWALQALRADKTRPIQLDGAQLIALGTEPSMQHFGAFGYLVPPTSGKNARLIIIPERLYQRAEATRIKYCAVIPHHHALDALQARTPLVEARAEDPVSVEDASEDAPAATPAEASNVNLH